MPPDPGYHYKDGLAVLRAVADAPDWMAWDERIDACVAPGHRLPDLRDWAAARDIPELVGDVPVTTTRVASRRTPRARSRLSAPPRTKATTGFGAGEGEARRRLGRARG